MGARSVITPRRPLLWCVALAGAVLVPFVRRVCLRWGASAEEVGARMPGDEFLSRADLCATRAISIDATEHDVWPWIAQLGQGRGGFYSYDFVENLIGCDIHSADSVVQKWQGIAVGDHVNLAPQVALTVVRVDPGRTLVLRGGIPASVARSSPYDFTWAFVLCPGPGGTTRLVVRERYAYAHRWVAAVVEPVELVSFIMSRRMMHGIRERSEQQKRL